MDVFLRALYTGCSGYEIGYEGTKKSGKSEKQEPKPSQEDWKKETKIWNLYQERNQEFFGLNPWLSNQKLKTK